MGGRGSFGTAFLLTVIFGAAERGVGILAGDVLVDEVEQEQVVVRTTGYDLGARARSARAPWSRALLSTWR